jgi:hypothetical protein
MGALQHLLSDQPNIPQDEGVVAFYGKKVLVFHTIVS